MIRPVLPTIVWTLLVSALLLSPGLAGAGTPLSFGVVPQQSPTKLALVWGPILARVEAETGIAVRFSTAPDIPTFERRLAQGEYDFAYMNPYHYTVFSRKPGYRALAHARDKHIQGIIVTARAAPYQSLDELAGTTLAFPSPAAFAATILTRAEFDRRGIAISAKYVASHDSVYRSVAQGLYPAGGGVVRTLAAVAPEVREQLRILWTSPTYTPHAIAAHPRVAAAVVAKVQNALIELDQSDAGKALIEPLQIKGWQAADDREWDDVRALHITLLDKMLKD